MRKSIFALILAALLTAFLAGPVLAVDCSATLAECDTLDDTNGGGTGAELAGLTFSPNVWFAYSGATNAYNMGAANTSGTRTYGCSSDYQGIYQTKVDDTDGTPTPIPSGASGAWASATWAEVAK